MSRSSRPQRKTFISHASEDKDTFVRPLAEALHSLGARIWYDEFELKPGASLSESIDRGLARSRHGIVVISRSFINKAWPKRELQGLVAREIGGRSSILPVWHEVSAAEVSDFSPTLADKLAISTAGIDAVDVALRLLNVIRPDIYKKHPGPKLKKMASGEALAELHRVTKARACSGDYGQRAGVAAVRPRPRTS